MRERTGDSVLVTGATGFIGQALCTRLCAEGANVTALVRRPTAGPWQREMVCELDSPAPARFPHDIDTVIHLAGRVHRAQDDPDDDAPYICTNVNGTEWLLEVARTRKVKRFVFVSSTKAMGEGTEGELDERSPAHPQDAYGRSKLAAERLVLAPQTDDPLEGVVVRLPAVYGPGSKGNVAHMLKRVRSGRFPPLPEFGNRRSLVHVNNVVGALLLSAGHPAASGQVFLVTDGCDYSTRALYIAMCVAMGKTPPRWRVPRWALRLAARVGDSLVAVTGRAAPFDSNGYSKLAGSASYSSRRIANSLGYEATHTLMQGLEAMAAELDEVPAA